MSLRINVKQGEILELTNIYTKEIIKCKCVKGKSTNCNGCLFIFNHDICGALNCNGNYREDKTFVHFIKVD